MYGWNRRRRRKPGISAKAGRFYFSIFLLDAGYPLHFSGVLITANVCFDRHTDHHTTPDEISS
jgi:hypothetical protein